MPDNDNPDPTVSVAKKYILKQLKVEDDMINQLRTNEEADELIEYIKKSNEAPPPPEEDEKKKLKKGILKANEGDFQLPDPAIIDDPLNLEFMDKVKPLRVNNAMNCRWSTDSRILRVYDDDYPEGRIF